MQTLTRCLKCEGLMSPGFIVDETAGGYRVSTWQSGEPKKSIWTGVRQSRSDQIKIETLRCERCGFLENYARG